MNLKTLRTCLILFIFVSTTSYSPASHSNDLLRLAKSLCDAAKKDDRGSMRKKLKSAKMRLRQVYAGINCGSTGSLLRVATKSGSIEAATFIATKIGKKKLAASEADGKTIIQWTEEMVAAGDASKQAFIDLYKSKL